MNVNGRAWLRRPTAVGEDNVFIIITLYQIKSSLILILTYSSEGTSKQKFCLVTSIWQHSLIAEGERKETKQPQRSVKL